MCTTASIPVTMSSQVSSSRFEHRTGALGYSIHHWDIPPNRTSLQQPLSKCQDSTKGPDCCYNGNRKAGAHPRVHGCTNAVRLVWLWAIRNCLCYCSSLGREASSLRSQRCGHMSVSRRGEMEMFPVVRKRRVDKSSVKTTEEVPCLLPELPGDHMIECTARKE